ncbi:beta-1,4-xylosyltransferase IRX9 [Andrographis paniculata]|uniref:beta-1,4-xylosyltransferase IRX9 n=1 Tax=Andrographis paniculata TaxID=175694 RepID=UPI0021E85FDB|nr:beta-1,4-xylosyltransferase IRX9 [Andrographis paniculata]
MGSQERSKKKVHLWKKAIVHFLLCFVMGFFTGFAPTGKSSIFSSHVTMSLSASQPVEVFHQPRTENFNRSLLDDSEPVSGKSHGVKGAVIRKDDDHDEEDEDKQQQKGSEDLSARRLVIVVTPTSTKDKLRTVLLRRLANTLKLVAPPLLWIVIEQKSDGSRVSEILRRTGIMYRHVVFGENFTDASSEMDHQRNIALNHIEHHRLSGIVHFAGLSNVYDLSFFDEIRAVEAFGTWPMARLSANRKRVVIEGPVCDSSEVLGWHLKRRKNSTGADATTPRRIHISSFAFNSSILWDPERWGRTSSAQDTSQSSLKFLREGVLEEESKLKGIPAEGCSKVLLWDLNIS